MSYCEDYPCCGHEAGCCPSFNEAGEQTNMICTCGAELPIDNPVSICDSCLDRDYEDDDYSMEDDYDDSMDGDWDSGMASAGFGMDEDYGYYGNETDF